MDICDLNRNLVQSSVKKMLTYCTSAATGLIGPYHVIQHSYHQKDPKNAIFHAPIFFSDNQVPYFIMKIFIHIYINFWDTSFHKIGLRKEASIPK